GNTTPALRVRQLLRPGLRRHSCRAAARSCHAGTCPRVAAGTRRRRKCRNGAPGGLRCWRSHDPRPLPLRLGQALARGGELGRFSSSRCANGQTWREVVTRKRRRLLVVLVCGVGVGSATALTLLAFRSNLVFFEAPSQLVAHEPRSG